MKRGEGEEGMKKRREKKEQRRERESLVPK